MNNREKQIIEGLLDSNDARRRDRCIELLFYGVRENDREGKSVFKKSAYVLALENIVRKCFSGNQYYGRFTEVYISFVTEFYQYLTTKKEALRKVEDLGKWLYTAESNFARNPYYRRKINDALGIDTTDMFESFSEKLDRDSDSEVHLIDEPQTDNFNSDSGHIKIPDNEDESDDGESSSIWAEKLLNQYINRIPHEYYRTVLRALLVEGMDREAFAEEQGKKISAVYNDLSRAMDSLLSVALPDIKWRTKKLFVSYGYILEGSKYYDILQLFYQNNKTIDELSELTGIEQKQLQKLLVEAYKCLQKVAVKEQLAEEAERNKEKRRKANDNN